MKINKKLNLVFPITRETGKIYIHSTPLSLEMIEHHALVISKTFALIYQHGLQSISGPRVAAMLLKQVSEGLGNWEGPDGVQASLLGEIRRTSSVIVPSAAGWRPLPIETAMQMDLLDAQDVSEAEGTAVFFICLSAMHRRDVLAQILDAMSGWWGSEITSLSSTEFTASLPILTENENSGKTAVLSVQS